MSQIGNYKDYLKEEKPKGFWNKVNENRFTKAFKYLFHVMISFFIVTGGFLVMLLLWPILFFVKTNK